MSIYVRLKLQKNNMEKKVPHSPPNVCNKSFLCSMTLFWYLQNQTSEDPTSLPALCQERSCVHVLAAGAPRCLGKQILCHIASVLTSGMQLLTAPPTQRSANYARAQEIRGNTTYVRRFGQTRPCMTRTHHSPRRSHLTRQPELTTVKPHPER